jgi:hypothetical protein
MGGGLEALAGRGSLKALEVRRRRGGLTEQREVGSSRRRPMLGTAEIVGYRRALAWQCPNS